METAKRIFFLLILTILIISPVRSGEKQAARISNTRSANCLVKITCDPAILPLNLETIDYLLRSSGVGGKARSEVLGISPDQDYDLFTVEYVQSPASDGLGGVGIPPVGSRTGLPSMFAMPDVNVDEHLRMMEEMMERTRMEQLMLELSTSPSMGRESSRLARRSPSAERAVNAAPGLPADEQTFLFRLNIHLPGDIKPVAKEFMQALLDYLRASLDDAYNVHSKELGVMLQDAESRRDRARSRLAEVMEQVKVVEPPPEIILSPADASVYEQLEQIVDLSDLTTSMAFADVIERLKNSVAPPLQIQPNWKDLLENAEIEQTTPAGMDPLTGVKLRKALEILLAGVSTEFTGAVVDYVVDEGVILIGTQDALPSKMISRVYEIPALAYSSGGAIDLIDAIQKTIEPESWYDAGKVGLSKVVSRSLGGYEQSFHRETNKTGKGKIISYQGNKLVILQTYEVHQKIWEFLQSITIDIPASTPSEVPEEVLIDEKNSLFREKQNLEMELARLQGRMPAIDEQIMRIKKEIEEKVQEDQISKELKKILDLQVKYLEGVKKLVDNGNIVSNKELSDAEEKLARAKIELARRREQIGASAGADQMAKFSSELATLTIDMAEKKAMLDVVKRQLDQTQQRYTVADVSDPQISRIRMATQALEIAERRVNMLNARLVNLQPPTVSILGGN